MMKRKEILEVLEKEELPKLRDKFFEYIEENRILWRRLFIQEIFKYPESIRQSKKYPLGVSINEAEGLIDIGPIRKPIMDISKQYDKGGLVNLSISIRRKNSNGILYDEKLANRDIVQQILFYDIDGTELSFQIKMKVKNRFFLFILEEDDIRYQPVH